MTIDSLRSGPSKLYAASLGPGQEVLKDGAALDSLTRRMRTMALAMPDTDKGFMGELSRALRGRTPERRKEFGY